MELEIKLTALPGEGLEPMAVHSAAKRSMELEIPAETIELEAHYHDDGGGLLRAAHWSLRARRENHRILATAKGPAIGVLARTEIETAIERLPSAGEPLPPPLARALADAGVPLTTWPGLAFRTRVRRTAAHVTLHDRTTAELAIDHGEVATDNRTHPICELELELKEGQPTALLSGALDLARQLRVRPGGRSKGARGLQLLGRLAPPAGVDPTTPAALWSRLTDLEEHLREGHHECLSHYLRVADTLTRTAGLPPLQIAQRPVSEVVSTLDSPQHATQLWTLFEAVERASDANDSRRS